MTNPIVKIDTRQIKDWATFHDTFNTTMGFPDFYGRNMNAWIDCMTYLDEPGAGMTTIHAPPDGVLVLQLEHVANFAKRCPELHEAIIEASAFVNWRRIEAGQHAVLAMSFFKSIP